MQHKHGSPHDLSLLPVLSALLRRRNVTRAAGDVGLSQPAMSRAFARLRDVLGDPLLVRTPGGYIPTPRGEALVPRLAEALAAIDRIFDPPGYDPSQERRLVRIAASDVQSVLVFPQVMRRVAREAPGLDLAIEPYGGDLLDRLQRGRLDLAFALSSTPLPPGVVSHPVSADTLSLVLRAGHPAAARRWTLADYGRFDHVGVTFMGDRVSDLDALLAGQGITRRMALTTPSFVAALAAVAASDMVTTVSRCFAAAFADRFGLVLIPPPLANVRLVSTVVTSAVRATDPLLVWLRRVIADAALDAGFQPLD